MTATRQVLRVRLFGHVSLDVDGEPFVFATPRKTLEIFTYLLLNRDSPVSREFLSFLLWPDDAEEGARAKLRANLYEFARILPPAPAGHWIVAETDSLRWNPEARLELDVDEFERASRDPERLEEAAELYRGDLVAASYEEWLLAPRERYRNQHLTNLAALVSRFRRERRFGRAIDYAERLLAADPWREDVVRRLIAIRHESGDRAGALAQYQRFASRLRDELDTDPMPETTALRDAIARDEAGGADDERDDVAPATSGVAQLPFVGRRADMDEILESWNRATRRTGTCVFIGGEAGIGKTRLATELARAAEERGGRILSGATGQPEAVPFQCIIDALRSALPLVASLRIRDVWMSALATLLPELHERIPGLPPLPSVDPQLERPRLFEAMVRCLGALAQARPLALVLEDLHWAGESTIAALGFVLRRVGALPIMVLATYRDDETPRQHPLRRLMFDAGVAGLARTVALGPLSAADVAELARAFPAIADRASLFHAASDGNPLFLSHLLDDPERDPSARDVPDLKGFIAARLATLSPDARTLAELAALVGPRFSREVAAEVSGWDRRAVQACFDELMDRHIVREVSGRGFFDGAFSHQLVAEVVAETAPPERAAFRHRRIARVLEDLGGRHAADLLATVARQYELADEPAEAARRYAAAAANALGLGALDEAASLAGRGLHLALDAPQRLELLFIRETVARRRADASGYARITDELHAIASDMNDPDALRRVLLSRIEFAQQVQDRDIEVRTIDALRAATDDSDTLWRARLREVETRRAIDLARFDEARVAAREALAGYVAAADVAGEAEIRFRIAEIEVHAGDLPSADLLLDEARAASDRAGDSARSLRSLTAQFQLAFSRRDMARCLEAARLTLETARRSGDRCGEGEGHLQQGLALLPSGDGYAASRRHFDEAAAIFAEIDDPVRSARATSQQAQIQVLVGNFEASTALYQRVVDIFATRQEPRRQVTTLMALSGSLVSLGDAARGNAVARQAIDLAREHGFEALAVSALEDCAIAEGALGDYAGAIRDMQEAVQRRIAAGSTAWTAVTLANMAVWQATVGDRAGARASIERLLVDETAIVNSAAWPQTCYWVAAQVLRATGEPDRAAALLHKAHELLKAAVANLEERDRATFLAIRWHADLIAAVERDLWPDPPR